MTEHEHPEPIAFTIDGRDFTITDKHQTATSLLALDGLDATVYDLAEVRDKGQPHTYAGEQPVTVKAGDEFLSVRKSAQVA